MMFDPLKSAPALATLAECAPVAMYHADATGRLTYANAAYRKLFELRGEQSIDEWVRVVHPDDRDRIQRAWTEYFRQPSTTRFQWRSRSAAGADRFLAETVVPMNGPGIEGFVGTIIDVTDYHVAQQKLDLLQRDLTAKESSLMQLETDLNLAMQLGHLELHYQPKLDVLTGTIHSAEALIRWRDPERGLISAIDFIPLAEASPLMGKIGEWVMREACRQTRAWRDEGLPPIQMAINLSPSQFRHGDLLSTIHNALDVARLDPNHLEVEVTENTVMTDPSGAAVILERLSDMGVSVSVDDFGTGYSSMSYLRRFPVDKLKIDGIFIQEITSRSDDVSIVRAIISLAHSLDLDVVAEGVETRNQLECLRQLGCDQYQGHFFSPAVPPSDFAALLRRSSMRPSMEEAVPFKQTNISRR